MDKHVRLSCNNCSSTKLKNINDYAYSCLACNKINYFYFGNVDVKDLIVKIEALDKLMNDINCVDGVPLAS